MKTNPKYIVGVFRKGRLLFKLFANTFPSYESAALACMLLEALKLPPLMEGDYIACDLEDM